MFWQQVGQRAKTWPFLALFGAVLRFTFTLAFTSVEARAVQLQFAKQSAKRNLMSAFVLLSVRTLFARIRP